MAGVCAGVKRAAAAAGESVVRVLQLPELVPPASAAEPHDRLLMLAHDAGMIERCASADSLLNDAGFMAVADGGPVWPWLIWHRCQRRRLIGGRRRA